MNQAYKQGIKVIEKQLDDEPTPIFPTNRHQRRQLEKVRQLNEKQRLYPT